MYRYQSQSLVAGPSPSLLAAVVPLFFLLPFLELRLRVPFKIFSEHCR